MKTGNNSLLKKMKHTLGFTLVELIVVISILVILGTIAFISLAGYSSSARDSNRIADFANISKGLQLIKTKTGLYPAPSSSTGITYSGWLVWTQWSVGDSVINILNTSGIKFSRKPMDPKYTNVEYTYSVLENNKEFQIATVMEQDSTALFPLISSAYAAAATENLTAYVLGNYNGIMARSKDPTNGSIYVLAIPSIILKDTNFTLLETITTQSGNLVINKKGNLPSTYFTTVQTAADKAFVYAPLGTPANAVGNGILAATSLPTDVGTLANLTSTLRSIYGTTELASDVLSTPQVANLLDPETTPANQSTIIATTLQTSLGGTQVVVDSSSSAGGGHILLSTIGHTLGDNNLNGPFAALNGPKDVAFDSAGNYYIADTLNNKVKKYDSTGKWLMTIGNGTFIDNNLSGIAAWLMWPKSVSVNSSGDIYIIDSSRKIKKYNSNGDWLLTIGSGNYANNDLSFTSAGMMSPNSITLDSIGNIYVSDYQADNIKKYSHTGAWLHTFTGFSSPTWLIVDPSNNIYINDGWRIKKVTQAWTITTIIGAGTWGDTNLDGLLAKFSNLSGIALDSAGNIFVTDSWSNNKIKKYSSTGAWLMTIGSGVAGDNDLDWALAQFSEPAGIKVDSSGYIYVADTNNDKIKKYSSDGDYVSTVIGYKWWDNQLSGIQAEIEWPMGITRDSAGNLYVGNSYNVKKYSPDGTFLLQIGATHANGDVSADGINSLFASTVRDLAVAANGDIYIVDEQNSKIKKYDSTGRWLLDFPTMNYPTDIEIDSSGNVFVSQWYNNVIKKFSSTGSWLLTIGNGSWVDNNLDGAAAQFSQPISLEIDNSWFLYISTVTKIKKYDLSGNFVANIPVVTISFVVGSNGHIYSAGSYWSAVITEYTETGALVGKIIGGVQWDNNLAGTAAGLNHPHMLYIDTAGNITISDTWNDKVKTYSN